MKLTINGKERIVESKTLHDLMTELNVNGQLVVVELAGDIIPREKWSVTELDEQKPVELVHFVGGG
ncbi:sulfur carrier protein ThiS [Shouchella miscanthi]|uniref:Sulfur carrier protein ThiS n=1 Tax=Shouchella miscanthi TaxID=2598861 RepID=A0ABU6NIA8_9BACI|nr:sulfur carrier protein ThiS [Shouchella miscanthi]MED4127941.1 sulfur carrier protein ThiS [Shouchella miscanthi]